MKKKTDCDLMKKATFNSINDIRKYRNCIQTRSEVTCKNLLTLLTKHAPEKVFQCLKFEQKGVEPITNNPLNIIEQINQTATYLASLDALALLWKEHPEIKSWSVNFGTTPGHDIISDDGTILAEVAAVVNKKSNGKITKDIEKLQRKNDGVKHRYVFYRTAEKITKLSVEKKNKVKVIQMP